MNNAAAFLVEELVRVSVLVSQCKSGSNDSAHESGSISALFALGPTLGAEESATGPGLGYRPETTATPLFWFT